MENLPVSLIQVKQVKEAEIHMAKQMGLSSFFHSNPPEKRG